MNKESNFKGRSIKRNINIDRLDFVSCVKKEKKQQILLLQLNLKETLRLQSKSCDFIVPH